jgi:hypothetical protein
LVPFGYQNISTVTDHYLYLPMAIAALAFASLVSRWAGRVAQTLPWLLILALGGRAFSAALKWKNYTTLTESALRINPRSYYANLWIAQLRFSEGDFLAAFTHAENALETQKSADIYLLTGQALLRLKEYQKAEERLSLVAHSIDRRVPGWESVLREAEEARLLAHDAVQVSAASPSH